MKVQAVARLSAFMALMLVVSQACGGGGSTPTPAPEGATEPPQAESTQAPVDEKYFTDEFENGVDNWSYFITKNATNADDRGAEPTADGEVLAFDLGKNLNSYAIYDPQTYDNVRIDVSVENRGTNNNNINLLCRYSDEGWYEISVANNGLFQLYAYDASKGSYAKLANGGSTKIRAGKEVNEYSFVCNNRDLILYVNGVETVTFTDNQYVWQDGQIGIGASSFKDIPVTVNFDWVKISAP